MKQYSDECLNYFLKNQMQLFDEKVAETPEEAEDFLEECMAAVLGSLKEVRKYFDECGMDISDMSEEELKGSSEVFSLPDGQYLVVEA